MARLADKVGDALNEARILVLGIQVLLGFQFQAPLQSGFVHLPFAARAAWLAGLVAMVLALALVVAPAPFHPIAARGHDTRAMHGFTTRVLCFALLPFALGLGCDLGAALARFVPPVWCVGLASLAVLVAAGVWYVPGALRARHLHRVPSTERGSAVSITKPPSEPPPSLDQRLREALTEVRVVLPGAQALLAFQFAATLQDAFAQLPHLARVVHLAGLALVALSTVLLMFPAAYHRVGEGGAESEHVVRVTRAALLAALVPLAGGIAGGCFVAIARVTGSVPYAWTGAGVALVVLLGCWFVLPWSLRPHDTSPHARASFAGA